MRGQTVVFILFFPRALPGVGFFFSRRTTYNGHDQCPTGFTRGVYGAAAWSIARPCRRCTSEIVLDRCDRPYTTRVKR